MGLDNQRRLVKANLGVRDLYWCGPGPLISQYETLRVQDFVMLKRLRTLKLSHWSGGSGSLKEVLMAVAGSLQVLELGVIIDVEMQDIVDAREAGDSEKKQGQNQQHNSHTLELSLVDSLSLTLNTRNPGIIELLDCCPNLKHFFFSFSSVGSIKSTITRLSGSLRDYCLKLSSMVLVTSSYGDVVLTSRLLRDGPVFGRLESLEVSVMLLDENLTSSILVHASALTYLQIVTYGPLDDDDYDDEDDEDDDGGNNGIMPNAREEMKLVLRLLVECRHLRRFVLIARVALTLEAFCGVLSSQPWGCVGMEHLAIETGRSFFVNKKQRGNEDEKKEGCLFISKNVAFMGWLLPPQEHESLNRDAAKIEKETLRMVFGLVQGLPRLKTLVWNYIVYTRCSF